MIKLETAPVSRRYRIGKFWNHCFEVSIRSDLFSQNQASSPNAQFNLSVRLRISEKTSTHKRLAISYRSCQIGWHPEVPVWRRSKLVRFRNERGSEQHLLLPTMTRRRKKSLVTEFQKLTKVASEVWACILSWTFFVVLNEYPVLILIRFMECRF